MASGCVTQHGYATTTQLGKIRKPELWRLPDATRQLTSGRGRGTRSTMQHIIGREPALTCHRIDGSPQLVHTLGSIGRRLGSISRITWILIRRRNHPQRTPGLEAEWVWLKTEYESLVLAARVRRQAPEHGQTQINAEPSGCRVAQIGSVAAPLIVQRIPAKARPNWI